MTSPELVAMMLADARLPTGGHTQSAGLEPAVRAGLGVDEVAAYAHDRLRTVVRVEAGTAVVAMRHEQGQVEAAWAARTPSRALRDASRLQGRGYLRLARRVWPHVEVRGDAPPRPLVVGAIAVATGLDARTVARLVAYDDVQTVVSAALKLLPVDPAEATAWLASLHPDIEALVAEVGSLTDPADIPSPGAPLIDHFAEQHTIERMRLFHA